MPEDGICGEDDLLEYCNLILQRNVELIQRLMDSSSGAEEIWRQQP